MALGPLAFATGYMLTTGQAVHALCHVLATRQGSARRSISKLARGKSR